MHVLRVSNPMNPEIMAGFPSRLSTNRSNPYTTPGAYAKLATQPLPVFGSYLCTATPVPDAPAAGEPLLAASSWSTASTSSSTAAPPTRAGRRPAWRRRRWASSRSRR